MGLYSRKDLEADLERLDSMDQSISIMLAEGRKPHGETFGWARRKTEAIERERSRCRMKLLNTGRIISDLRAAKLEFATAESETEVERARRRLNASFATIRHNSDGRKSAPETLELPQVAEMFYEIPLVSPEAIEQARALQASGKRVVWRPREREVAQIYEG